MADDGAANLTVEFGRGMGPGSRSPLAGDTNCIFVHLAQRRIPDDRGLMSREIREPALNLIQGPCWQVNRNSVAAD